MLFKQSSPLKFRVRLHSLSLNVLILLLLISLFCSLNVLSSVLSLLNSVYILLFFNFIYLKKYFSWLGILEILTLVKSIDFNDLQFLNIFSIFINEYTSIFDKFTNVNDLQFSNIYDILLINEVLNCDKSISIILEILANIL